MNFRNKFEKLFDKIDIGIWGILGGGIVLITMLITALGYTGRLNEPFSILNHFISELGEYGISDIAIAFNLGLIIGGLAFLVFMIGLFQSIDIKIARVGGVLGVISAVACIGVGFFPMNMETIIGHAITALSFFLCGKLTVVIYTISILVDEEQRFPKSFSIVGIVVAIAFIGFIASISMYLFGMDGMDIIELLTVGFDRPEVWSIAYLEWAAVLGIIGWVVLISVYQLLKKPL
jgi:hypothetical membrane protein